jgi:hypothetical protein
MIGKQDANPPAVKMAIKTIRKYIIAGLLPVLPI